MPDLLETIRFWSRQLGEHCLFLELGLDPQELKNEAQAFHAEWENFRATLPEQATTDELEKLIEQVKPMAMRLRFFKLRVYERQIAGEWLGWLYPSFVKHVRLELEYFMSLISGRPEREGMAKIGDELCIWLGFMRDHCAFASHLLDPSEKVLFTQALALEEKMEDLLDGCQSMEIGFLVLSQKAGVLLDKYFTANGIGTPKVESVIHPVLALHVVREGRMFLRTLEELRGEAATAEIPE